MTWIAVTDSKFESKDINAIVYGSGKFVAVGMSGKMAYSSNGITWTAVTGVPAPLNSASVNSITFANNKFVAVGAGGSIGYSSDGVIWNTVSNTTFSNINAIRAIAYGNGKFIAGAGEGKMAYSSDGVNWTTLDVSSIFGSKWDDNITGIVYAKDKFVAVGGNFHDYNAKMAYSSDGVNWTAVTDSPFDNYILAITFGNGKFVAGGYDSKMAYSTDGISWTVINTGTIFENVYDDGRIGKEDIRAIAFGGDKYVVGSSGGKMATSIDGVSWTLANNPFYHLSVVNAIAYGSNTFVAGNDFGEMAYSTGN